MVPGPAPALQVLLRHYSVTLERKVSGLSKLPAMQKYHFKNTLKKKHSERVDVSALNQGRYLCTLHTFSKKETVLEVNQ